MATECIAQLTFECYPKTRTVARFDQARASTDGGVVLLKALDNCLQLTDRRDPDKIRHAVRDLLRQRVFGLACGYEDGNDAARLVDDPMHKLAVGRDPVTGDALASQPTLSRFENAVTPRALYGMGRTLAEAVIAPHRHRLNGRARRRLCRVLSAWRYGEPTQGITSRAGAGPHELLAILGQSIPCAPDGCSVCVVANVAATGPRDGLRHGSSLHATAQVSTLRERLLKLAVWVERSVRRIVLPLPRSAPWRTTWQRVAVAVGAVPG